MPIEVIDDPNEDGYDAKESFLNPALRYQRMLRRAARKRVKPIPEPVWSIDTIESIGLQYPETDSTRFLFYWLYLTGQRISEALEVRREDIKIRYMDGKKYLYLKSKTRKNKMQRHRNIPIPFFGPEEKMTEYVWNKIENMMVFKKLFGLMTRQMAYNNICKRKITVDVVDANTSREFKKEIKLYPHYLRHCRATHMATEHGYELYQLMRFFGWSSSTMANTYAYMNADSLAKKMGESFSGRSEDTK